MPELPEQVDRIVLIGLMGSGKTTVGRLLAGRLGWRLVDLDTEIERKAALSTAEIFEQRGEQTFRWLEQQLTSELASTPRMVFTPGGGWAMHEENVRLVRTGSAIFWLRVTAEEAVRRIEVDDQVRPLLAGDMLGRARTLAAQREAIYAQHGIPIETVDRPSAAVANEILTLLGQRVS